MHEISFKGKRIDTGQWIEGYLFFSWERAYILWGTTNGMPDMIEVDSSAICQYTGLTDKNGRKIFEGDILDAIDYKVRKGVVKFGLYKQPDMSNDYECGNQGFYVWFEESGQLRPDIYYWHGSSNVIGNIFDNPALLKGGDGT